MAPAPVQVAGIDHVVELALGGNSFPAGTGFTCALRDDASIWCWGINIDGDFGDGNLTSATTPTRSSFACP